MQKVLAVLAIFSASAMGVCRAATITSPAEVDAFVAQPLTYQITADNAPTSFSATGLTTALNLTLNRNTGVLSGTPKTAGTYHVTVKATGKSGSVSKRIVFVISKQPVLFTNAPYTTGTVNTAFTFQVSAAVSGGTYAASNLPAGLKINSRTGLITGTPTQGGEFGVELTDASHTQLATGVLAITISGGTAKPAGLALRPATATVGTAYIGVLTATGATPLTFAVSSPLPPGLALSSNGNFPAGFSSNGNIIFGTPTTAGTYMLAVSVSNSVGAAAATLKLIVAPANGAPLITSPLDVSGEVAESFDYRFTAAGGTPLTFTADATQLPRGVSQTSNTELTGVPFDPGVFAVPISAQNDFGADNEVLNITVASLAPSNTSAIIKFTDSYRDSPTADPTGAFSYTAVINTPGVTETNFGSQSVDVTVGIYEFAATLNAADRFRDGKSANFLFSGTNASGNEAHFGNISFTLLHTGQIKIVARHRGDEAGQPLFTLRSQQFANVNKLINETIPVKIQIGSLTAAFYVNAVGSAKSKLTFRGSFNSVRLKGSGGGTPSN